MSKPKPSVSHSEALDKIFKIPAVKKMGECHVSGLPRCTSLEKFQSIMTEKEDKKKKEEKEEWKWLHEEAK